MNRRTPQAQRKFAQVTPAGSGGPGSVASTVVPASNRTRLAPRERKPSVVFSNLNVHQLLDLLSFQSLKKPVKKSLKQPIINLTKCDVKPPIVTNDVKKDPEELEAKPPKITYSVKQESPVKEGGKALTEGNMSLRNRLIKTFVKKTPPQSKCKTEEDNKLQNLQNHNLRARRSKRSASKISTNIVKKEKDTPRHSKLTKLNNKAHISDYSSEDETPLKYIPRTSSDRVSLYSGIRPADKALNGSSSKEPILMGQRPVDKVTPVRKGMSTRIKRALSEKMSRESYTSKRTRTERRRETSFGELGINKKLTTLRKSETSVLPALKKKVMNKNKGKTISKEENSSNVIPDKTEPLKVSSNNESDENPALKANIKLLFEDMPSTNSPPDEIYLKDLPKAKLTNINLPTDNLITLSVPVEGVEKAESINKHTNLTDKVTTNSISSDKLPESVAMVQEKVTSIKYSTELRTDISGEPALNEKSHIQTKRSLIDKANAQKSTIMKVDVEKTAFTKTDFVKPNTQKPLTDLTPTDVPGKDNSSLQNPHDDIIPTQTFKVQASLEALMEETYIENTCDENISTVINTNITPSVIETENYTNCNNLPDNSTIKLSSEFTFSETSVEAKPKINILESGHSSICNVSPTPSTSETIPKSVRSWRFSNDSACVMPSQESDSQAVVITAYYSLEMATSDTSIKTIKEEIEKPENPDEVYEFHSESETETPPEMSFRQRRKSFAVTSEPVETTHYWRTGLVDYVIEEKAIKIPGREERVRHCKLILKSDMDPKQTIDVDEWKGFLDAPLSAPESTERDSLDKPFSSQKAEEMSSAEKVLETPVNVTAKGSTSFLESAGIKRKLKTESCKHEQRPFEPHNKTEFPHLNATPCKVEAPVFHPTEAEFKDPLEYLERITPVASKFGICKIVPPRGAPTSTCHLPDEIKFSAYNQYLHRMYQRWGPATREVCAIKKYSAEHAVSFERAPLIDGVEVDLPQLFKAVQDNGGLKDVMDKGKWAKIAQELRLPNVNKRLCTKLDNLYVKYLLPYDMLSNEGRQELFACVEQEWSKRYKRMVVRARSPTRRQRRALRPSASSESDDDSAERALDECEDCVTRGRTMTLHYFRNVASVVKQIHFPGDPERCIAPSVVEHEYWKRVMMREQHACVYTAAVDSGEVGLGFPKPRQGKPPQPPWNLKVLSQNTGSMLRSLGPVLGVTVPTVHVGMIFSTSCWNRDPHGLPWIEYHHTGAPKLWYGIPDEQSEKFKKAVETLAPSFCQNKTIWLPSDVLMLPPDLLTQHGVSLSGAVQRPGELIVVFPKAYTSSVCTDFTVSESVYFGPKSWLATVQQDFQEARESCEPTMFPLEQLLLAVAGDLRATRPVLLQIHSILKTLLDDEKRHRRFIVSHHIRSVDEHAPVKSRKRVWSMRYDAEECDICRSSLYLSKVTGLTGKNSLMCPAHAVTLLEQRGCRQRVSINETTLVCRLTDPDINNAQQQLESRLGIKR